MIKLGASLRSEKIVKISIFIENWSILYRSFSDRREALIILNFMCFHTLNPPPSHSVNRSNGDFAVYEQALDDAVYDELVDVWMGLSKAGKLHCQAPILGGGGSKMKKISMNNNKAQASRKTKEIVRNGGGGGGEGKTKEISMREYWKIYQNKKPKINYVGWQHKRVDNNKTNKAHANSPHQEQVESRTSNMSQAWMNVWRCLTGGE